MQRIIKKYSYILSLIWLPITLFGQQDPKAFYIDSLNHLFVSPKVPVSILVGTKPDGSDAIKMKGIGGKGSPLYWNGHGPIQMTHLDLYIGRKIKFTLFADGVAPQTMLRFNSTTHRVTQNPIYIMGGSIIEISATDTEAGLYKTFYSVNGSNFKEYDEPITLNQDGAYEIKIYSIDNLGNKEDELSQKIIVDSTPPTSRLITNGDRYENTLSGRSALSISATDSFGVANIKYRIDSAEYAIYGKPIQTAKISEGEHSIMWFSTDKVGNKENIQNFTFYVDKTPPMVFEEIIGNSYMVGSKEYSSGRSHLKIAAVDNKSGVKEIYYSLNNGKFDKYEKLVLLSDIKGVMDIKLYATDNVNNHSQSGTSAESFTMPTIDIAGPTLTYKLDGAKLIQRDTLWIGPSTKIQINANDNEAGVSKVIYSVNKSADVEYSSPFCIKDDGYFLIKCTAFDNVDNLNFLSFELGVDCIAPEIFYHFSVKPHKQLMENNEAIPVFSSDVKIFLATTDNLSGDISISYSINQEKPILYKNPIEKLPAGKIYLLKIAATDKLGNSSAQSLIFKIE